MTARLLVVDDEPDTVTLFRLQFRREIRQRLYALDFALSGQEALETLATEIGDEIALLISDINLPGLSGLDLLPAVRKQRPDLPVFMMSAYSDAATASSVMTLGATRFLTKPMDFPLLKQLVAGVIPDAGRGG